MIDERDFYVGYLKTAPPGLARFVRALVVALVVAAAALALLLSGSIQGRFDPGLFEFGVSRTFEGVIEQSPYPVLLVEQPEEAAGTRYLLVGFGKHGAERDVAGFSGRRVRLEGTLVQREGETMVEIAAGSVEALSGTPTDRGALESLGTATLAGEIVDSKCFLGVMKPGRGKPHRACATRCISGGVPPVLRVETEAGRFRNYLLTAAGGVAVNQRVLDLVAEPVEITGRVFRRDNLWFLEADPVTYHRIETP